MHAKDEKRGKPFVDQEGDQRLNRGAEDLVSPTSIHPISSKTLPIRRFDTDWRSTSDHISPSEASARFLPDDLDVNKDRWKTAEVDYSLTTAMFSHTVATPMDEANAPKAITLSVIAIDGLIKEHVFRYPDPFVVVTVDGAQTRATSVLKKTCNPYFDESFELWVTADSVLNMEVYDQKDTKCGLLGYLELRISKIIDIFSTADGMPNSILSSTNISP